METTGDVGDDGRTPVPARSHRVHWFAGRTHEILDEIASPAAWALTPAERRETITELISLKDRIDAHLFAVVAEADHVDDAATHGATNTAAHVRSTTGITGAEASSLVRQSRACESHPATSAALAAGVIHTEQARVIVAAVDALPTEVTDRRAAAERHLLELAQEHDAKALKALGKHLLEVIAPDKADALLARRLEAEEAEARRTTYVKTWRDGNGSRYIKAKVPDLHGDIFDSLLHAYANPNRPTPIPREGAASPQIYGQAFCELLEHYPVDQVPHTGGVNVSVVVTMTLDTLLGGLEAAGVLGTDTLLSPGEARRLSCAAGVIPAVLNGQSQLLDLGRRRTFSPAQRLAMSIRQGGRCNIAGCERPATWCDANHRILYSKDGRTRIEDGELICPRHHTHVHRGFHYPRRT